MNFNLFKRQSKAKAIQIARQLSIDDLRAICFHFMVNDGLPEDFRENYKKELEKEAKRKRQLEIKRKQKFEKTMKQIKPDVYKAFKEKFIFIEGANSYPANPELVNQDLLEDVVIKASHDILNGKKREIAIKKHLLRTFENYNMILDVYKPSPRYISVKPIQRPKTASFIRRISNRLFEVQVNSDE